MNIDKIKENIIKCQNEDILMIIDEIINICSSCDLTEVEKLKQLHSYREDISLFVDNLVHFDDIEKYLDDDFIIQSYWKASYSAKENDIEDEYLEEYIKEFLVGYLTEHIRICKSNNEV